MTTKTCTGCGVHHPKTHYVRDRASPGGLSRQCKDCRRKHHNNFRKSPIGRSKELISSAKGRAKRRGLKFNLTYEWVLERLERGECEATGLKLELAVEIHSKGKHFHPWSPSIDRINPKRGYTTDNCQIVVWAYNQFKGQYDRKTLTKIAEAYLRSEEGPTKRRLPGVPLRCVETPEPSVTDAGSV